MYQLYYEMQVAKRERGNKAKKVNYMTINAKSQ